MNKTTQSFLLCFGLIVTLAFCQGCRPNMAPVYNVSSPIGTIDSLTEDSIRTAIYKALAAKNWRVVKDDPGKIEARVTAGGHWAQIVITYTSKAYEISYQSSSPGLKYDGEIIHRRYNHWINLLDRRINEELMRI